jgi:hypothetical protein
MSCADHNGSKLLLGPIGALEVGASFLLPNARVALIPTSPTTGWFAESLPNPSGKEFLAAIDAHALFERLIIHDECY